MKNTVNFKQRSGLFNTTSMTFLSKASVMNDVGDDCDWKPRDVGTPSLNTGPIKDQSGAGSYLYMEASGCYSKTAYLESPKFDFSQETSPYIQFYYHMYQRKLYVIHLLIGKIYVYRVYIPLY